MYREEKGRDSELYVLAWLRRGKNRENTVCVETERVGTVSSVYIWRGKT